MALRYNYNNPIGHYTLTQVRNGEEKKFKISILSGNCLWVEMYFYNEVNEETGVETPMESLYSFFADLKHVKNCVKDTDFKLYENADDFHFNPSALTKDAWKVIEIIANLGKRITIYNEEEQ